MPDLEARLLGAFASRRPLPVEARRALLHATELLTCSSLVALNRLGSQIDPRGFLLATLRKTQLPLAQAEEEARIVRSRLQRIRPRERYRLAILAIRHQRIDPFCP